jgi:hypothetical protein
MTTLSRATIIVGGLFTLQTITSHAQERTLDATLASINTVLQNHSFVDFDDKLTITSLSLMPVDSLTITTSKAREGTEVSTIYQVALGDVDLASISCVTREGHSDIVMKLRGEAKTMLRCIQPSGSHEWTLPPETQVPVAFRSDPPAARALETEIRALVRLACSGTRHGTHH